MTPCWEWEGAVNGDGYGTVWRRGGMKELAHRVAYGAFLEPIPVGLQIDHLCRNPRCVNPAHLEPVTVGENLRRSPKTWATRNAAKTTCLRGHAFDATDRHGHRVCRTCIRERRRWSRERSEASQ